MTCTDLVLWLNREAGRHYAANFIHSRGLDPLVLLVRTRTVPGKPWTGPPAGVRLPPPGFLQDPNHHSAMRMLPIYYHLLYNVPLFPRRPRPPSSSSSSSDTVRACGAGCTGRAAVVGGAGAVVGDAGYPTPPPLPARSCRLPARLAGRVRKALCRRFVSCALCTSSGAAAPGWSALAKEGERGVDFP